MAKEIIHVGIGATLNPYILGGRSEIISLAACAMKEDVFRVNIAPAIIPVHHKPLSKQWAKSPEGWEQVISSQVPRATAVRQFNEWLGRYHGTHIAVCRAREFHTLFSLLMSETGKCSFGERGHLDYATYVACKSQDFTLQGRKFAEPILPWEQAVERMGRLKGVGKQHAQVNLEGYIPKFEYQRIQNQLQDAVQAQAAPRLGNWAWNNANQAPVPFAFNPPAPNPPIILNTDIAAAEDEVAF